jgi:hypothetical protein
MIRNKQSEKLARAGQRSAGYRKKLRQSERSHGIDGWREARG